LDDGAVESAAAYYDVPAIEQPLLGSHAERVRSNLYRILLIVIALIVYGSLYPWDFHSTQLAASPLWVLIHSWPDHIDRFLFRDIAVNVVIYLPVGVFGLLALRQKFPTPFAVTVTVLLALALSSSIEMTQLFDDARDCNAFDVVFNVSGTVLGVALGYVYQQWLKRFLARAETAKLLHPSGAVLLFYTWLAYQGFPLFPVLSRTRLGDKFRYLFAAVSISPLETFSYFVEWLVVAQLLENVLGAERTRRLFPLLLVVLPAKLLVAGRTVTWSELAGAVLACISWYFLSRYPKRTAVVGGLMVSLLIVRGLVPYHWSRIANPFSWVPFGGFLRAPWDFGLLTLLQKSFWYGSAVWLLRAAGWRLARAAIVVVVLLGAIEVIQIHLPGRVAEITDPLLALLLAMTLGLLDRSESVCSQLSSTKVRCGVELP
jgi:VanZ family protein